MLFFFMSKPSKIYFSSQLMDLFKVLCKVFQLEKDSKAKSVNLIEKNRIIIGHNLQGVLKKGWGGG